jgi:hypothetical protein
VDIEQALDRAPNSVVPQAHFGETGILVGAAGLNHRAETSINS